MLISDLYAILLLSSQGYPRFLNMLFDDYDNSGVVINNEVAVFNGDFEGGGRVGIRNLDTRLY